MIVDPRLRIGDIIFTIRAVDEKKQQQKNTEIYLPLSNATHLSNAPLGVWPCYDAYSVSLNNKPLTLFFGRTESQKIKRRIARFKKNPLRRFVCI